MMDKDFDRILGEKLSRIEVKYDPESWQLLEQRLDVDAAGVPEADDKELDEAVFHKLHHYHVPYNSSHWHLMSSRLEQEFSLVRQILRYKVLELGMVGLLLLTIIQYLPLQTSVTDAPWKPQKEKIQSPSILHEQDHPAPGPSALPADRPVAAVPSEVLPAEPVVSAPAMAGDARSEDGESALAVNTTRSPVSTPSQFKVPVLENNITNNDLAEKLQRENQQATALSLPQEQKPPLPKNSFEMPQEDFLTTALDPLYPGLLSYNSKVEEAILEYQPPKRKTFFRVGMFGGVDYNRIITPADEELGLDRLSRYAAGYGGGLTFGLEFGRWETETGLIYAAKQYQARPIVFFQGSFRDGYLGRGVKDIEINVINVPLNFRYNFLRNEKWRMYALAGASIQVAVQANYYTANQDRFRSASFRPAPAPTSGNIRSSVFRTPADELPGGWFEGGSFEENGYLTGNVGLGLERYFSGQWSIFVQPTYQHSINYFLRGLGPTKDEINTFSMYTGIRLRLKK